MAAAVMAETMETRFARLESDVAHLRSDVMDIKVDIRELRRNPRTRPIDIRSDTRGLCDMLEDLRDEMRKGFTDLVNAERRSRILLLILSGMIFSVLARGFHWI